MTLSRLSRLWPRSLVGRLVLWAAVLFAVSLPLFWALFSAAVMQVSREVVDTRLLEFGNQLRGYWASSAAANDGASSPEGANIATAPLVGADIEWVWQISVDGKVADRSQLLRLTGASLTPSAEAPQASFALSTVATQAGELRLAERLVEEEPPFQSGSGNKTSAVTVRVNYMAGVAIDRYRALVEAHAARLRGLALLGVIPVSLSLIGMLAFIIIAIRRSLARVEDAMHAYEHGDTGHIEGHFPRELQALVDRMNNLLRQNMKLVERTRKYVTKIAHDINHPLAIMKNGLAGEVDKGLLGRQVERMVGLVERYSSLARAIGPEGQIAARTDVAVLLADTAESFSILYRRTPVAITHECEDGLSFAVPRHDLEAMVSNLVSNAHKYCQARVHLSARLEDDTLVVTVDDDGPGIPAEQRTAALNWGKRLDEAPPGTGFGLSIVRDIIDLYEGKMRLDNSPLGGLRVEIRLPGKRA